MKAILILSLSLLIYTMSTADTIYLKNGRQIECTSAWEEEKEVKYTVTEGTMGIPKSMVARIVKGEAKKEEVEIPEALKQQTEKSESISPGTVEQLEKQHPSNPTMKSRLADLYTNMGLASLNKRDLSAALEYFQKAYQLAKTQKTTLNLALIYFVLKDDWNAELYFNELLKKDSKDTVALNYLGEISWRKEDLSAALSYWQQSHEIKPDPAIQEKLERLKKEKTASDHYEDAVSRHFLIKYDDGSAEPNLVREIHEFLEEAYRQLSTQYEEYPSSPFVVVLYPKQQFFHVTDAPMWSAGINDGKIKLPLKGIDSITDEIKGHLIHELSHSFVDIKTSRNCPTWLQEGLAQYSEGTRVGEEGIEVLARLISTNQLPPIAKLSGSFMAANSRTASILYLESLAFTEYLIDKYQFYQVNELLAELGKGVLFFDAFENTYMIPLSQVESEWKFSRTED